MMASVASGLRQYRQWAVLGPTQSDTAMGNAASDPGYGGVQTQRHQRTNNDKQNVQPPKDWHDASNNKQFHLISPSSDLSNPSQFRHRNRVPLSEQTTNINRRRASKVMSKTHKSNIPPPMQFYFPPTIQEDEADERVLSLHRSRTSSNAAELRVQRRKSYHSDGYLDRKAWLKARKRAVRANTSRAKRAIASCWEDRRKAMACHVIPEVDDFIQHKRLPSIESSRRSESHLNQQVTNLYQDILEQENQEYQDVNPAQFWPDVPRDVQVFPQVHRAPDENHNNVANEEDAKIPTFNPLWKEKSGLEPESFLHNPDECFDRIVNISSTPTAIVEKRLSIEPEATQREDRESDPTSPVVALFDAREDDSPYDEAHNLDEDLESPVFSLTSPNPPSFEAVPKDGKSAYMARRSMEEQVQQQIDQQLMTMNKPGNRRSSASTNTNNRSRRSNPSLTSSKAGESVATKVKDNDRARSQANKILEGRRRKTLPRESAVSETFLSDGPTIRKTRSEDNACQRPSDHAPKTMREEKRETLGSKQENESRNRNSQSLPTLLKLAGWKEEPSEKTHAEEKNQLPLLLQLAGWEKQSDGRPTHSSAKMEGQRQSSSTNGEPKQERRSTTSTVPKSREEQKPITTTTDPEPELEHASKNEVKQEKIKNAMSIASMLQQTYPVAAVCSKDVARQKQDYRSQLLCTPSSVNESLAQTPMSSGTGAPAVPDDVLGNAAFLFSPSYNGGKQEAIPKPHHQRMLQGGSFSLSTVDSRSRVSGSSRAAISIPVSSGASLGIDEVPRESTSSERHVRFSLAQVGEARAATLHVTPGIKQSFSDLTDTTSVTGRPNGTSTRVSTDKEKKMVSPIPEVSFATDGKGILTEASPVSAQESTEEVDEVTVFEDTENDLQNKTGVSMGWSYRSTGGNNGVTPFRPGRGVEKATNSPFVRFTNARHKFSSQSARPSVDSVPTLSSSQSSSTVRLSSGLVVNRIAAVEDRVSREEGKRDSLPFRRATSTILEETSSKDSREGMAQQILDTETKSSKSTSRNSAPVQLKDSSAYDSENHSPTLVNGKVVDASAVNFNKMKHLQDSSVSVSSSQVSHRGTSSVRRIMDPVLGEEDSISSRRYISHLFQAGSDTITDPECETDDEFAAILNGDDETAEIGTITTVRQMSDRRASFSDSSTIASNSVATVQQSRASESTNQQRPSLSTVYRRSKAEAPFREVAPVRPNEQNPRAANPGALCLSPMQRTPMQARKWRALAAAAQEKDSKRKLVSKSKPLSRGRRSLVERHPNIMSSGNY